MKQLFYFSAGIILLLSLSDCSIFDQEEFSPYITFENTLGGGGVDVANDVIELEHSYLIVGAAGPECDIMDGVCLLLDKETGRTIQFNHFGRSGQGNEDNFFDVEQLSENKFVATGFTSAKAAIVPYDTCRICRVYDEDFVFDTIPACGTSSSLDPRPKTNGNIYLAHFDSTLTQIGGNEFISSNDDRSRWDAGYNLSVRDNKQYIAGAWRAFLGLLITDENNNIIDTIISDTYVGEYRDIDVADNGEIVMTGFTHCFSDHPPSCGCPPGNSNDDIVIFAKYANEILTETCYPALEGMLQSHGESIVKARDGSGYLITGYAMDYDFIKHILLIRIEEDGTERWTKVLRPGSKGNAIDIADDAVNIEDGYVLTGDLDGDLLLMKIDFNGNEVWTEIYNYLDSPGNNNKQGGKAIISTTDGGYLVVGTAFNDDGSSSTIYVVKTDARGKVR